MSVRTVVLRIKADVTDLPGKLKKAQNDMKSFADSSQKKLVENRSEWNALSTGIGLTGVALIGMAAIAVKSTADFDKSMSRVKASGKDAADNISALRDAAIEAGADTMYSAADAADAITDLAKAGVSAKDILGGALTGSLALAASGEMDVKDAAETTSVALTQFGLKGGDASHVADLLAAGAGKAMGEVSDLGMALSQGGLVAHQTGLSIEETVGALSAFASAGMLGSDAGTSLKTMLQRLTPQSAQAQAQMDELGISAYDSQGNFVGLANYAGQLSAKLSKLSPEARNSAMSVMFGSDAVRAANVLYTEGAKGVQGWIDAVNDQGFASRQAAELTDNLSGDVERLSGSLDTVFIQSGSGANAVLRQFAQAANVAVDAIGGLPEPILSAGALLTGSGGLGLAGAAGVMKIVGAVSEAKASMKALSISAKSAKFAVGGIGAAIAIGTLAISAWAEAQAKAKADTEDFASTIVVVGDKAQTTDATLQEINKTLQDTTTGWFGWGGNLADLAAKIGVSSRDAQGYLLGEADARTRVNTAIEKYLALNGGGNTSQGFLTRAGKQTEDLRGGLDQLANSLSEAKRQTLQKAEADYQAGIGAKTYSEAVVKGTDALKDYTDELFKSANAALKLSGTEIGWQAAIDDTAKAIKKTGKAQRDANGELDANTAKGRANQTALNQLASASIAYAQNLMEQGKSEKQIQAEMSRSRSAFIKSAVAAGMTKSAAAELADEYGLIPSSVKTKITDGGTADAVTGRVKHAKSALDDLNGKKARIGVELVVGGSNQLHIKTTPGGTVKLGYASGGAAGAIVGAGTGTSDSIPAMLSNGEHVLTASDVQKAGGQSAIYRMREGIQAGLLHFAGGGAVEGFAKGGAAKKKQARENAAERAKLLEELKRKLARGTIGDDMLSGSGLSVVDDLLDWSTNTALSKKTRSRLRKIALDAEKQIVSLTKQLDKANAQVDSLQSIYDDVYGNLSRSGSSLSQLAQGSMVTDLAGNISYQQASASSMASKKKGEAAKLGTLSQKLNELRKAGASAPFLQEIASIAGSDVDQAISVADQFLSDTSQISVMNSAYDELTKYSAQAAQYVTESAYSGGLSAAKGVVDGLNDKLTSIGKGLADAFAGALGYKGATTKKRALGGPVTAGELYQVNELGVEMFRPAVSGVILTASQTQQAIGTGFTSTDLARAISGLSLVLLVDGKPVQAVVQAQLSQLAQSLRYGQGSY